MDGLLTELGNYSPLTCSKAEAPGNLGGGDTDCQTFKNLKQKKSLGNLPASREQGRAEVHQPYSLCPQTASAVPSHSTAQRPPGDTGNLLPS